MQTNKVVEYNECTVYLTVALDGTLKKCRYTSFNGKISENKTKKGEVIA
jgi:hypothetical protein